MLRQMLFQNIENLVRKKTATNNGIYMILTRRLCEVNEIIYI